MNRYVGAVSVLSLALVAAVQGRAVPAQSQTLPRVVVLATGGTIASKFDPGIGALAPSATGADLVRAVPDLEKIARIDVEQIANIGSYDMTPEVWRQLSKRANALLARNDVSGVVVTHGTDTLEETAYFLDLTVTSSKPVVLVGAQRAASYFDSDGPRNLLNAVRVAISPEASDKGTLVVMNGQINAAREVTKTNTIEVETFRTLEFGALGVADLGAVRFYRAPLRRHTAKSEFKLDPSAPFPYVEVLYVHNGANPGLVKAALDLGAKGIVVAGAGSGSTGNFREALAAVAKEGKAAVVRATRVGDGRVLHDDQWQEPGMIAADSLSAQKAALLLSLALMQTTDTATIQRYFDEY
jgi:L-asparaginase